jgi:hypothetical protein
MFGRRREENTVESRKYKKGRERGESRKDKRERKSEKLCVRKKND